MGVAPYKKMNRQSNPKTARNPPQDTTIGIAKRIKKFTGRR